MILRTTVSPDGDGQTTATCDAGIDVGPASAPDCNAYAERFVRSIKEECLERIVPVGEWHLRPTICEFVEHYDAERNHQGIGNALIDRPAVQRATGPVRRRQRVGGILNFYCRAAA